jgi:hypothetical protein
MDNDNANLLGQILSSIPVFFPNSLVIGYLESEVIHGGSSFAGATTHRP